MHLGGFMGFVYRFFIFIASAYAILLILRECGITEKINPMRASDFVSVITIFLILYVVSAFLVALCYPILNLRIAMILFGITPFVLGKAASYKEIKTYSIIQILCVILSIMFLLLNY